jgi:hypothetical protein
LSGSVIELGNIKLRKRHLQRLGHKVHVIEYPVMKKFIRKHQKIAYITKAMKGVARKEEFMKRGSLF